MPKTIRRQLRHLVAQVLGLRVGVVLGGRDTGVAQKFLESAQIGPSAQGVGGDDAAQQMRPRAVGDPHAAQIPVHQQRHAPLGEAVAVQERGRVVILAVGEVVGERLASMPIDWHPTYPLALADQLHLAPAARGQMHVPRFRRHSSPTRRPVLYSKESMARSRAPVGVSARGWSSRRTTSSTVRCLGARLGPMRIERTAVAGRRSRWRFSTSQRKKERAAAMARLMLGQSSTPGPIGMPGNTHGFEPEADSPHPGRGPGLLSRVEARPRFEPATFGGAFILLTLSKQATSGQSPYSGVLFAAELLRNSRVLTPLGACDSVSAAPGWRNRYTQGT